LLALLPAQQLLVLPGLLSRLWQALLPVLLLVLQLQLLLGPVVVQSQAACMQQSTPQAASWQAGISWRSSHPQADCLLLVPQPVLHQVLLLLYPAALLSKVR
jgi:hypothetical protein